MKALLVRRKATVDSKHMPKSVRVKVLFHTMSVTLLPHPTNPTFILRVQKFNRQFWCSLRYLKVNLRLIFEVDIST